MTICRAGLVGMVIISLVATMLVGGAWIYFMHYEFIQQTERLREQHYAEQKELVKTEAEKAVVVVHRIRREYLQELDKKVANRVHEARVMSATLAMEVGGDRSSADIRQMTVDLIAAREGKGSGIYRVRGNTIYLLAPFPGWLEADDVLDQAERAAVGMGVGNGRFR